METMVVKTMVVSVSKGVVSPLLAKLTTLMGDEFKKLKGVRKQVSFLKNELTTINAFLETLELMDELDPLAKDWRSHVLEMAYDIEDCIDNFMYELGDANPKEGFMKKTLRRLMTLRHRHPIANQIDDLKARVLEASERRTRYRLDELASNASPMTIDPRVTALYTEAANLVGIDGPREELVKWLTDTKQQVKVVSVVGFGGLGKTTLAKEVYHNIGKQFSCKAFVTVSQRPDMMRLLNGIQSKLGIEGSSPACEVQDIIDSIRKHLKRRRYFIVVDDLWDAKAWDIISCAFPENGNGSRVIVTTRMEDVASRACGHHHECIYRMKPLNSQDSRRLFFSRVFGCEDGCHSQFEDISDEILKKCGGLPLAIITIASLLASRPGRLRKEWEIILNSLNMHIGTYPTLEGVRQILELSYKHLPPHLRTCLLCLGIYPEDSVIKRDDLIRQWVAEGIVSNSHGHSSDDVGKSYFNELINRSLIQPESTDYGEVLSCRVHDMMLDLILYKCEEDNFITLVCSSQDMARQRDNKVRRLSLSFGKFEKEYSFSYYGDSDFVAVDAIVPATFDARLSHVRSLAMFGKFKCLPPLLLFKYLRVLIIDIRLPHTADKLDLTYITQLFLLRYLKIHLDSPMWSAIQLPRKIQGLKYLEVLEIKKTEFECVPSDIIYLPYLTHLTVDWCRRPIDGLGNMKSLRTLVGFPLELDRNIRCLGELGELRVLMFEPTYGHTIDKAWMDAFLSSLAKLRNLRYLRVGGSGRYIDDKLDSLSHPPLHLEQIQLWGWKLARVPRWINGDLKKLYRLTLAIRETSTEEVRVLGELPSLVDLRLDIHDKPHWRRRQRRPVILFATESFPALEKLDIHYGDDAASLMRFEAPGVLPNLQSLTLRLWTFDWGGATPAGMEHLLKLRHIHLEENYWEDDESANDSEMVCFFRDYAAVVHPSRPSFSTDCETHNKRSLVEV